MRKRNYHFPMIEIVRDKIKRIFPKRWIVFMKNLVSIERLDLMDKHLLALLQSHYGSVVGNLDQVTIFKNHEFKVYSQHGEDGLILYIFSKVGITDHRFVEIGVETGRECNTSNLSFNFGWHGLLVDANEKWLSSARSFYKKKMGKRASTIKMAPCFVTAENINQLLLDNDVKGEIDLLSIDIDGNDYWVWKAITVINPRVVVMEYNATLGSDKSLTVKYDPSGKLQKKYSGYHGASLVAMTKLANSKGYILVGCEAGGVNAFFVRKDVAQGKLVEVTCREAYYPHYRRLKHIGSVAKQFERVKHLDFDDV